MNTKEKLEKLIEEKLKEPLPQWLRDMYQHYHETRTYKTEHLIRLLGDITQGVEVGPNTNLLNNFRKK